MFTGVYEHTIDKKGRTSMPARFRSELGGEAFISVGIDKNLVIYSTEHFNAMAAEIGRISSESAGSIPICSGRYLQLQPE